MSLIFPSAQGENAYTPLQMANYVATIGNDGKRNKVSLLKAIEGETGYKGRTDRHGSKDKSYFKDIIEGMRRVAHIPGEVQEQYLPISCTGSC